MGRQPSKRVTTALHDKGRGTVYTPLPGFAERAPGVWIPEGYRPTSWEQPTPIVRTPEEAATEYLKCTRVGSNGVGPLAYFAFSACWTLHTDDPSGTPTYRKVPRYPFLIDFFTRMEKPENIHLEKSRQLLMSWAWMIVFVWDILFHDAWANLAISYKQRLVDDGAWNSTEKSLLGKVRIVWQSLPPHLQHPLQIRHLRVLCPMTGSYIAGDTAGSGGRGGTFKRAIIDEAAHVGNSEMMFRAVGQACKHGLGLNSSPMGKGNLFARIRFEPRSTFHRISYHWTLHPEKARGIYCTCGWIGDRKGAAAPREQFDAHICNVSADPNEPFPRQPRSPWYDAATADYTPEQVASEFDLSYEKSMRGRVYEPFDETRHVRNYEDLIGPKPDRESALAYRRRYLKAVINPQLETVVGWDFGVGDPTSLCLGQVVDEHTMKIRWIDEYEKNNQSWDHFHKFVYGLWQPLVKEVTNKDLLHYGDPSGSNRGHHLDSWVSNLRVATLKVNGKDVPAPIVIVHTPSVGEIDEWFDFIANLIRIGQFEVLLWCAHMIDGLGQYHFPLDNEGNPVPGRHLPVHDKWSHMMSAMRYVYQFRWAHRLHDVHAQGVGVGSILAIGEEDRIEQPPENW